jgi:SAM-dependent methyltransferase
VENLVKAARSGRAADLVHPDVASTPACRFCGAPLTHAFVDLGSSPLANAFLTAEQLDEMEPFFPLRALVCEACMLVQLPQYQDPNDIFGDYPYFSSYSSSWREHLSRYAGMVVERFGLTEQSLVIEVGSNDGCLLACFQQNGIPVLGIEPAANVAEVARADGVPTRTVFFGLQTAVELAREGKQADLLIGNNVLAHVPDLNDFVAGLKAALKPDGRLSLEFPHLLRLIEGVQFDTIYHEHFSYFSLLTVMRVLARHGLLVFDVEELPTHGGSLRIFATHWEAGRAPMAAVIDLARREHEAGLARVETYAEFQRAVRRAKNRLLTFLIEAKAEGKTIVGYGAPAKGNTLLNYCGIRTDFIDFTVDANPNKQGLFLPGTHIPVLAPDAIDTARPDYVVILPWNLKDEIIDVLARIRAWGGRFVVPIPEVAVI